MAGAVGLDFTFDEATHAYSVAGESVPSVTQILQAAGLTGYLGPEQLVEAKRRIGVAVHAACEYLDQDDLDLESLDPAIQGYVLAYQTFKRQWDFVPSLIEHKMIAEYEDLRFAMTLDRFGEMRGHPYILDLKTSASVGKTWGIQLAAYRLGLGKACSLAAVHLKRDGKFKLVEFADDGPETAVFQAALRLSWWKIEHGVK